jgi:hypothetical protein
LLQTKLKAAESTAKKLQRENDHQKVLLKEKDRELEQKDQQLEERDNQYDALLEKRAEDCRELSDQNVKLKQRVATSSRLDNQITDETFRESMSYAYVAIHDCFYGVLRRKDISQLTSLDSKAGPTTCLKTHISRSQDRRKTWTHMYPTTGTTSSRISCTAASRQWPGSLSSPSSKRWFLDVL